MAATNRCSNFGSKWSGPPFLGHKQPTIHYILSNCPEVLQQGRYTSGMIVRS